MLIRAKKHVLSSYSYSNLSFHRKITKTTQKWVVFFYTKKTQAVVRRWQAAKKTASGLVRRGFHVGSPLERFNHSQFGYNGRFLR